MNSSLMWGSLLILVGFSLVFKTVFGISIPIVRPLLGILLLYVGFTMIIDPQGRSKGNTSGVTFSSRIIRPTMLTEKYDTAFGSSTIDLTAIDLEKSTTVDLNTAFGTTKLIIKKEIPTKIALSASFSYVLMPDGSAHTLGQYNYYTSQEEPLLVINMNAAFANIEVITV